MIPAKAQEKHQLSTGLVQKTSLRETGALRRSFLGEGAETEKEAVNEAKTER